MATARRCATGSMSSDHCARARRRARGAAGRARPTMSAATTSAPISTWSQTHLRHARRAAAARRRRSPMPTRSPSSPTGPATTAATPSMPASSSASSAGSRPRPSRPASRRRCAGISTIADWVEQTSTSGAYRDWVDEAVRMKLLLLGKRRPGRPRAAARAAAARRARRARPRRGRSRDAPASCAALVAAHAPDVIVNAAAYTAVDQAETDADRADLVNAEAVGDARPPPRSSAAPGWSTIRPTTCSTARKPTPYVESRRDRPAQRLRRDQAARRARASRQRGCRHLILRTSWVYRRAASNFAAHHAAARRRARRRSTSSPTRSARRPAPASIAAVTAAAIAGSRERGRRALAASITSRPPAQTAGTSFARFSSPRRRARARAQAHGRGDQADPDSRLSDAGARGRPIRGSTRASSRRRFGIALPPWQDGVASLDRPTRSSRGAA